MSEYTDLLDEAKRVSADLREPLSVVLPLVIAKRQQSPPERPQAPVLHWPTVAIALLALLAAILT